jgi:hypothetical protein
MSNGNAAFQDVDDYYKTIDKLVEASVRGALARPEIILQTALAAHEGLLNEGDGENVWSRVSQRQNKRLAAASVTGDDKGSKQAFKTRVSEMNKVIEAACCLRDGLVSFHEVLEQAKPIIVRAKNEGVWKSNTQDAFVQLARAQANEHGQVPMDEAMIEAALQPSEKQKEYEERKETIKLIKALDRHINGTEKDGVQVRPAFPSTEASIALKRLEDRLAQLGGAND